MIYVWNVLCCRELAQEGTLSLPDRVACLRAALPAAAGRGLAGAQEPSSSCQAGAGVASFALASGLRLPPAGSAGVAGNRTESAPADAHNPEVLASLCPFGCSGAMAGERQMLAGVPAERVACQLPRRLGWARKQRLLSSRLQQQCTCRSMRDLCLMSELHLAPLL